MFMCYVLKIETERILFEDTISEKQREFIIIHEICRNKLYILNWPEHDWYLSLSPWDEIRSDFDHEFFRNLSAKTSRIAYYTYYSTICTITLRIISGLYPAIP